MIVFHKDAVNIAVLRSSHRLIVHTEDGLPGATASKFLAGLYPLDSCCNQMEDVFPGPLRSWSSKTLQNPSVCTGLSLLVAHCMTCLESCAC